MIKDIDAKEQLVTTAMELILDDKELAKLSENIQKLAEKDSADRIALEVMRMIK